MHNVTLGKNFNQRIGKTRCNTSVPFKTCLSFLNLNTTHWGRGRTLEDIVLATGMLMGNASLLRREHACHDKHFHLWEWRMVKERRTVMVEQGNIDGHYDEAFQPRDSALSWAGKDSSRYCLTTFCYKDQHFGSCLKLADNSVMFPAGKTAELP